MLPWRHIGPANRGGPAPANSGIMLFFGGDVGESAQALPDDSVNEYLDATAACAQIGIMKINSDTRPGACARHKGYSGE
jgi:hypothetical protein